MAAQAQGNLVGSYSLLPKPPLLPPPLPSHSAISTGKESSTLMGHGPRCPHNLYLPSPPGKGDGEPEMLHR